MSSRRQLVLLAALACAATPALAQSSISVIPTIAFVTPTGNWVNNVTYPASVTDTNGNPHNTNVTYGLKAKAGLSVGLIVEYSMNKRFGIAGMVSRTLGGMQRMHEDYFIDPQYRPSSFFSYDVDMATTNLGAMLIIRPLGRTPSGAPKTFYIELGGGVNIYDVSKGFSNQAGAGDDWSNYNYTSPMALAGLGFSFPVGRRVSLQIFGRGSYQFTAYDGPALTSTNGNVNNTFQAIAQPVPTGEKPLLIHIGMGLRVGR